MTAQRITGRQIDKLIDGRDEAQARLIEITISNINLVESQIADHLRWVMDTAERIEKALTGGGRLNDSGEFGRNPLEADRLIALRQAHYQTLGCLVGEETGKKIARREF